MQRRGSRKEGEKPFLRSMPEAVTVAEYVVECLENEGVEYGAL